RLARFAVGGYSERQPQEIVALDDREALALSVLPAPLVAVDPLLGKAGRRRLRDARVFQDLRIADELANRGYVARGERDELSHRAGAARRSSRRSRARSAARRSRAAGRNWSGP